MTVGSTPGRAPIKPESPRTNGPSPVKLNTGRAYALQKGWTVPDELIFVDDGISGAEFIKRPGFIRLMNALKPKPSFSFLVMSEESRLGRESIETSYALKQITDANVRVFFYLEDRERTLDNAMDKVMLSLSSFASEMERERGKQRTYDAMRRKATAGHVTGGKTFGYDNREVLSTTGHRLHVLRIINPAEAAIVRQIFEMFAGGIGIGRIAKRLNDDGTPAPRLSPRGWAPSAIRAILLRPLYKGEIVWNQHEKIVRGGTRKRRKRDEKEWIRFDAPDVRIIPRDLWEKVNGRLPRLKEKGDLLIGIRSPNTSSPAWPGVPIAVAPSPIVGASYARESGRYYGCSYYKSRGSSICKNSLLVEQDVLDQIVLKSIQDVLTEKMLNVAIEKALAQHRAGDQAKVGQRVAVRENSR